MSKFAAISDIVRRSFLTRDHGMVFGAMGVFAAAVLLAWPVGNFPLNDDWTYAKSLITLDREGTIDIGTSSSALVTQLFYGLLFVKIFGFSFSILRISTLISVLIFIVALYYVIRAFGKGPVLYLFFAFWFVLSPIYFSLAGTFMTDVNFCTLLACCFWQAADFHRQPSWRALALFFVFSLLLVFLRQFGLLVPVAFSLSCLLISGNRWRWLWVSAVGTLVIYFAFMRFENSMSDKGALFYHSTGKQAVLDPAFWNNFITNLSSRWAQLLSNVAVWCLPLSLIYMMPLSRRSGIWQMGLASCLAAAISYFAYHPTGFPLGNVFINLSLGAETFFESIIWPQDPQPHPHMPTMVTVFQMLQVVSVFCLSYVVLMMVLLLTAARISIRHKGMALLLLVFITGYVFALMMPEMFLDRYLLPLMLAWGLLLLVTDIEMTLRWPVLALLLPFAFAATAGTHDYFSRNRLRWEAYRHLREEKKVPLERINGGYEVNSWHEGQPFNWYDYLQLDRHEYLIQYKPEKGFGKYKLYPFRRYLSFSNDSIVIYERSKQ